jgi:hypothetical protein
MILSRVRTVLNRWRWGIRVEARLYSDLTKLQMDVVEIFLFPCI